jgi:DNA-directed RNA polymerase subunit L
MTETTTKLDVIKEAFEEIIKFLKDFLAKLTKALPDKVYGWNKDAE